MTQDETIDDLVRKLHEADCRVESYKAGNTQLLHVLMTHASKAGDSVEHDIAATLKQAGMMRADDSLDWPALAARESTPITWAYAVERYVTDPTQRERLLSLDLKIS